MLFNPEPSEMYDDMFCTHVDMDVLTKELCGLSRPTHFRGVCTVVTKLFNIVAPDNAYFGQKDAQQLAVIKRMVKDLNMDIAIHGCPIVREADGLAKSSRNTYLSKTVELGKKMVSDGETDSKTITDAMKRNIETEPLAKIDYVKIVDALTMQQTEKISGSILCAMAVYIGKTRLIDNFIVGEL